MHNQISLIPGYELPENKDKINIAFRSDNGYCPYFIHRNMKYFIQDERGYDGQYKYALYQKTLEPDEIINFKTNEEAIEYMKTLNKARCIYSEKDKRLFTSILYDYILIGTQLKIRKSSKPLSGNFDKYLDCLEFAKKYIGKELQNAC